MYTKSYKSLRRALLTLCLAACGTGGSWATTAVHNVSNTKACPLAVSAQTSDTNGEYAIQLTTGGTLQEKLLEAGADLATVTTLTVTGPINGTDIDVLHGKLTALTTLDLSNANICAGGDSYHDWKITNNILTKGSDAYNTENNVVGDYMFCNIPQLQKLVLPSTVTKIGKYAVAKCPNLTDIQQFPQGVTWIDEFAFYNTAVSSITLGAALQYIGKYAFSGSGLTSITIPGGVTQLQNWTFEKCAQLTEAHLPETMTSIGQYAFHNCKNLESTNLPGRLESLGSYAFAGCSKLSSIEIPASLQVIGTYAFSDCSSLKNVVFNEGLTNIGDNAFQDCESLTKIELPSTVERVGRYAFSSCQSIASLKLPERLKTADQYAFSACRSLTEVTLPAGITHLADNLFSNCTSLTTVNLSPATQSIGTYSFYGCDLLKNIDLSLATLNSIGASAFRYCISLKNVTLSNTITTIGSGAFSRCSNLQTINIPTGVTELSSSIFSDCPKLEEVAMHNQITAIGSYAFSGCELLSRCTLPESITTIGNYAFDGCVSLPITSLPTSLQTLGSYVFRDCTLLNINRFPNALTSIGNDAFFNTGITTLDLSESPLTTFGLSTFSDCQALTSVILPNTLIATGVNTFYNCKNLSSVTLPQSLQRIDQGTFHECTALSSITLPESLQSIEGRAFEYSGLKSIEIPDNVTSLGILAFYNCKNLESAKLSKRLTYDNNFSYFQGCTKMTKLRIYAGVPPTIDYEPYLSFRTNCVLEVPRGTEDLYRNAAYWKEFKEINGFLTGDKLNAQDFAALQEMYNSLGGENWTHKWDLSNDDCYTGRWYGVSTEDNQIVSINLSGNGLSGRIPSSVFELPMLTTLDLSNGEIDMLVDDILEYTPNRVNIQKLYLQNNKLKGDVYAFINKLPTLQEVDLTCNQLTEVSEPLNSTVLKTLKLYNQFVRNGEFVYNPEVLPAEIVDLGLPSTMSLNTLQRYNHDSNTNRYLDASGMATLYKLTITENGNISWSWLSHKLKDTDKEGVYEILPYNAYGYMLRPVNNTIHFMSARESGGKYYPKPLLIRYIEGDINVDRYVDVTDLSTLLQYFQLGERWSSGVFNYSAADGDKNNSLNVLDIVLNVNHILNEETGDNGEANLAKVYSSSAATDDVSLCVDDNGSLLMNISADTVAALQIDLRGTNIDNVRLSKDLKAFSLAKQMRKDGSLRVVIYSNSGEVLKDGAMVLLTGIAPGTTIMNAVVSNQHAQRLSVNCNADLTGIALPDVDENTNDIYDISGRKVTKGNKGVFIIGGQKVLK